MGEKGVRTCVAFLSHLFFPAARRGTSFPISSHFNTTRTGHEKNPMSNYPPTERFCEDVYLFPRQFLLVSLKTVWPNLEVF